MNEPKLKVTLTPKQQAIFEKIVALREYTRETGHRTTRSQNDLLQQLDGDDLATILVALKQ